jgi:SAM-dependent methyltransferase
MSSFDGYSASAGLYDLFPQTGDLEFYGRYALRTGRAVDIGAGTGRLAIPLARRGVELTCVEPSAAMCREFRQKLKEAPDAAGRITLIQADAGSFGFDGTFPAAFMAGSFDHLLTDRERLDALGNIAGHLEPGGKLTLDSYWGLMVDSPLRHSDEVQDGERTVRRLVGREVQSDNTVKITIVYEIYKGGRLEDRLEQSSRAGIIDRERVHQLLAEAGFGLLAEYRDYDLAPYREGDQMLLIEAEKE